MTIVFQKLLGSNEERYCTNASELRKPTSPCHPTMTSEWKLPTFSPNRTTSAWTNLAQNHSRYASSSFRSTSRNTPSTSQQTENHLASFEWYSPMLTTKSSTTTRHGSCIRILAQHQFYQRPPPRAHKQDQHWINLSNTRTIYSNTNTMYANTRRRKRSTRNTKLDLRLYLT